MGEATHNQYLSIIQQHPYDDSGDWNGKITVCFSHPTHGWILLWIAGTVRLQFITIYLTYAFDPFPDLIRWLVAIENEEYPCKLTIDEEGVLKTLLVQPGENGYLDFQIIDDLLDDDESKILFRMRVTKQQFLTEFVRKFTLFRNEYYQVDHWQEKPDVLTMDLSKFHHYL